MRRLSTVSCSALVLVGAVFAAATAGCELNTLSTPSDGGSAPNSAPSNGDPSNGDPSNDRDGDDSKGGSGDDGSSDKKIEFKPSNIPVDQIDLSKVGDVAVNGKCKISSDKDDFRCGEGRAWFTLFTQPDASRVGMYVVKSFRVEASAILEVEGKLPIVIVALDKMEVLGMVRVSATGSSASPGGFTSDQAEAKGGGPGGGGAGSDTNAGGGGGYCGVGGTGAATKSGIPASGGKVYGNPEISPLLGGSAGGAVGGTYFGGAGGGALQLVAGTSFLLSATGVIHAGGGHGSTSQFGGGGGSGGAILIEAKSATIAGTLAANGGSAGSGWGDEIGEAVEGRDATPDDVPAPGGVSEDGMSKGGAGAAAATIDGGDGTSPKGGTYTGGGGGGGGAGRIRINTKSGAATISGTISPSANTPCFTQGKLAN